MKRGDIKGKGRRKIFGGGNLILAVGLFEFFFWKFNVFGWCSENWGIWRYWYSKNLKIPKIGWEIHWIWYFVIKLGNFCENSRLFVQILKKITQIGKIWQIFQKESSFDRNGKLNKKLMTSFVDKSEV